MVLYSFIFSYFICTPRDENSQGQPYKIIKHLFGDSLVILVSHHNAGFFLQFSAPKSYQSDGAWQKLSPNHDFTFMVIISSFQFVVGVPILPKNAKIVIR